MTYPGAIPQPSTPGFVSGGGGHVVDPRIGGFERGMKTLLDAIAERKRQELAEMQFKADQRKQAELVQTTEQLGQYIKNVAQNALPPGVPAMNLNLPGTMGGATPLSFGSKPENPYRAAIRQTPNAVLGAVPGQTLSSVEQERNRIWQAQQKAKDGGLSTQIVQGDDGLWHAVDKNTGLDILTGKPVGLPKNTASQPAPRLLFNTRTQRLVNVYADGTQRELDPRLVLPGNAPEAAKRMATFYIMGAPQFRDLVKEGMPGLSGGAWEFAQAMVRSRSKSTIADLIAESSLSDKDKRLLDNVFDLVALELYGRSGAAVRAEELSSANLSRIPLSMESADRRKAKYARMQRALAAAWASGYDAINRMPDDFRAAFTDIDITEPLGTPRPATDGSTTGATINLDGLP